MKGSLLRAVVAGALIWIAIILVAIAYPARARWIGYCDGGDRVISRRGNCCVPASSLALERRRGFSGCRRAKAGAR